MPIATPEAYRHMIDTAKSQLFAFPAVNCEPTLMSATTTEATPPCEQ